MAQGWNVNQGAGTITFYEPPANGSTIVINEYGASGNGGTNIWAVGAWSPRFGFPREVEFFNDRLWFAGTPGDPQTLWASEIGNYTNFGRSSPIVDSDSVTFAINARQVNVIKDLVPLDSLLILTTGGEYRLTGGQDDVITPSTIGVKAQGSAGTGDVQSKVIGDSAIFLQEEGQKIRDLGYQFEKDGFRGNDISVWADHLFMGHTVKSIEYWKAPWQVAWFIREDGIRIGCTYMPEQEVIGWHRHDTLGDFLDVCSLPGTEESQCYYLVSRVIDGQVVQCVEQQAPTRYDTESDLFYVDCGLTYDGRNTGSTTLALSAESWSEEAEITLRSSHDLFKGAEDIGDGFAIYRDVQMEDDNGDPYIERRKLEVVIEAVNGPREAVVHSIGEVGAEFRISPNASWDFQRNTISGLYHLEGQMVAVLQDGAVTGPYRVSGGRITLDRAGGVVQVGLPYSAEIQTLELNSQGGEPMRDQNKLAYQLSALLLASRGVKYGGMQGELYDVPERSYENYGQPPYLKTGVFTDNIPAGWGPDAGRVRIVSQDPLPMEVLSITTRAVSSNSNNGGATNRA